MRLFVAVLFSPELRQLLLDAQDELRAQSRAANFTRPENLHLTLAFLGETPRARDAAKAVASLTDAPFPLALGRSGRFSDLWWIGVEPNPALETLAAALNRNLRAAGFALEDRPFRPHVTIAREVDADGSPCLTPRRAEMTVSRVSLMKSERIGGKLVYTEIAAKTLGK